MTDTNPAGEPTGPPPQPPGPPPANLPPVPPPGPTPTSLPHTATAAGEAGVERWLLAGGAVGLIIGAFLPWVTLTAIFIGTVSFAGTEGDGLITLGLGVLAGVVAGRTIFTARPAGRGIAITLVVVAAIATLVAGYDLTNIQRAVWDLPDDVPGKASVGIGLWLTTLAAVALLAGGILALTRVRKATPAG